MSQNQEILELFTQKRDIGFAALATMYGYAELMSNEGFGSLTPEVREFIELLKNSCPKAVECWCFLAIETDLDDMPQRQDLFEWYRELRNEGLTPLFWIKGCGEFLLTERSLVVRQRQIVEIIVHQCEQAIECWWYPEYSLQTNREPRV